MDGLSIHPRSWPATGTGKKRNTCAPRSRRKLERQLVGISAHFERHPHDIISRVRIERLRTTLKEWK